jgi:hypothetical protein
MTDLKRRRWTWEEVQTAAVEEDGSLRSVPTRRLRCKPGEFPWDEWQLRARAAGVPEALASLGRGVIREAYQHTWSAALQSECGWDDDGEAMIELALRRCRCRAPVVLVARDRCGPSTRALSRPAARRR